VRTKIPIDGKVPDTGFFVVDASRLTSARLPVWSSRAPFLVTQDRRRACARRSKVFKSEGFWRCIEPGLKAKQ
jgi:hypothetical protein